MARNESHRPDSPAWKRSFGYLGGLFLGVVLLIGAFSKVVDPQALVEFFDAKFSEALKTVGKQFDFVDLYNSRERFKEEIF